MIFANFSASIYNKVCVRGGKILPIKKTWYHYSYIKFIGAGFSFSVFMFIYLVIIQFDLFELSQTLKEPLLWIAFYGYGMLCSILIDVMIKFLPKFQATPFILYGLFGFFPFIFFEPHIAYIMIAGIIGLCAALLFYVGVTAITKNKWTSIVFSVILPLLLVFVMVNDFTQKINWQSERLDSSYEASFSYFHGEHKIPIKLTKGEKLTYTVTFYAENDGGWGYHFENKKGDYLPMAEDGHYLEYDVEKDEKYFIVIGGDKVRGNFNVKWNIQ